MFIQFCRLSPLKIFCGFKHARELSLLIAAIHFHSTQDDRKTKMCPFKKTFHLISSATSLTISWRSGFVCTAPSLDSTSQQWSKSFTAKVHPASLQVIQLWKRCFLFWRVGAEKYSNLLITKALLLCAIGPACCTCTFNLQAEFLQGWQAKRSLWLQLKLIDKNLNYV